MAQEVIKIRGGRTLNGEVNISGAKNSAVAIIPATLLAQGHVKLEGLPQISDVKTLVSLLEDLNIKASLNGTELEVDTTEIQNAALPNNKVESLRNCFLTTRNKYINFIFVNVNINSTNATYAVNYKINITIKLIDGIS